MMNTCDIREYFDNILLGNPEEIIDNLSIIEDHFFYVVNFINENGGEVFYITNRKEAERKKTLDNLLKEKFIADNRHLIMKTSESSKESRRNQVEKDYQVVAYLGDDINDFIDAGATIEERKNRVDELSGEFGNVIILGGELRFEIYT